MLRAIAEGRTDLVFDWLADGGAANAEDGDGVPIIRWCAYYGDVSALKYLLDHGERLEVLGFDLGLNAAAFHGHWQLSAFLIERGADPNQTHPDTRETPLHAAFTKFASVPHERVVEVLLAAGARTEARTASAMPTNAFMRDVRTCGETPLHRAAAYGTTAAIRLLLAAGARIDARDDCGDSPLTWASRALRSAEVLNLLCFPPHHVYADRQPIMDMLIGRPVR